MKFISLEKLKRFYEKIKTNIENGTLKSKNAENADKVGNYSPSELWRSNGATWNPNTNVTMSPTENDQKWSFNFSGKNGNPGSYFQVHDEDKKTLFKVDADGGKVSAPYGFVGDVEGKATSATNDGSGNNIANTYATKTDLSKGLSGKSDIGHTHDDSYYTEDEIDTKLSVYMPKSGGEFTGAVTVTEFHSDSFYPKSDIDSRYGFKKNITKNITGLELVSNDTMNINSTNGVEISGDVHLSHIFPKDNIDSFISFVKTGSDTELNAYGYTSASFGSTDGDATLVSNSFNVNIEAYKKINLTAVEGVTVNNDCNMLENLTVGSEKAPKNCTINGKGAISGSYSDGVLTLFINN